MKTNNVLDSDDKAIIRLVAIMFHTQYIKPADRLMGPDEKMPWGFREYMIPMAWVKEFE